jgi:imidazolonepropionase-like amidohydrolase
MTEQIIALTGGKIIDGSGAPPQQNGAVLVRGERIEAVGPAGAVGIPPQAEVIDATGQTVMPGLIDGHLHLLGIKSMNQVTWIVDPPHLRGMRAVMDTWRLIDAGFTTVRDCGGLLALYLKQAIAEGSVIGPRIVAAGMALSQTAGHADWHFVPKEWGERALLGRVADGVAEVRRAAREQLREGADFLKIMTTGGVMSEKDAPTASQYSMEEIRAFVEEARNAGVRTATHAQGTQGIKNALLAGVDSIEHGFYLDDECIELMLAQGAFLVPTFAVLQAILTKGPEAGVMESSLKKARQVQQVQTQAFRRAYDAGVKCGLGTDYLSDPTSPMGGNAIELQMYVEKADLSPLEAIVCATRNNAELLGLADDLGTLEPGKLADLILVDGDPLEDIAVLRDRARIARVFKGGTPVPRLNAGLV